VAAAQDCKYLADCARVQNAYDMDHTYDCTGLTCECIDDALLFNCAFLLNCQNCSVSYYLVDCYNVKDCCGCVGLRNKRYCVLNKQCTRADYYVLLERIIGLMERSGEWGEFFPISLSPFGYNETLANYSFPLGQAAAVGMQAQWTSYQAPEPQAQRICEAGDLADQIRDVSSSVLQSAIRCAASKRLFRLTNWEYEFYRRHQVPAPRKHPEQRHIEMLQKLNPQRLWTRTCACTSSTHGHSGKCQEGFLSAVSPARPDIIYCMSCFSAEQSQQ
jgi:hypothetical protein